MRHKDKFIEDYLHKLMESLKKNGSLIIGYDFDDTVHPSAEFSRSYVYDVQQVLRELRDTGVCRFILITCREGDNGSGQDMAYVEKYLFDNDIPYNAINQNLPWGLPQDPRKIYCNIMIDDKCGLPLSLEILKALLKKLTHGYE